jgi:hypothetical protein
LADASTGAASEPPRLRVVMLRYYWGHSVAWRNCDKSSVACIVGRRRRAAVPSAFNRDGGEAGRRRVTPGTRDARPASTPCGCRSRAFRWWAREESSTQPTSQGRLTLRRRAACPMAARRDPTNARRERWSGIARDFSRSNLRCCLARASWHSAARVLRPSSVSSVRGERIASKRL